MLRNKAKVIYKRLAHFTKDSLDNVTYSEIRDYNALYPAFIRNIQKSEDIEIPSDIIVLIESYYVPNKLLINSFKFQFERNRMGYNESRVKSYSFVLYLLVLSRL